MITRIDEAGVKSFELTEEETQELQETGFVVTDNGYCITCLDGDYQMWEPFDDYSSFTLHR